MRSSFNAAIPVAIFGLLLCGNAVHAQVSSSDQVNPQGATQTLQEKGAIASDDKKQKVLQGKINQHGVFKAPKEKVERADDTVYGKTLNLNIGIGGAHLN